jgi:hypothetical protein
VPILLDEGVAPGGYVTGANRATRTCAASSPGRDFPFERVDVRTVEAGRHGRRHALRDRARDRGRATSSSSARATPSRSARPTSTRRAPSSDLDGLLRLGPARIARPRVEQFADEHGISWPRSIAPFDVELVGAGQAGSDERELAERLYGELRERPRRALRRPRRRPGQKFADAELLGVPLRLTVGRRTLEAARSRRRCGAGARHEPAARGAAGAAADLWREPPVERARLTFRRLSGLDRSGPPPPRRCRRSRGDPGRSRTRSASPLSADPGVPRARAVVGERHGRLPVILFAVIAWTDYLDGIAARVTASTRASGTLLDPLVDRLWCSRRRSSAGTSSCCRLGLGAARRARVVRDGARAWGCARVD